MKGVEFCDMGVICVGVDDRLSWGYCWEVG